MAGWKEFAFEWRERGTAYPAATVNHISIYGDTSHTLYTIDASGSPAHHHMGHLEVVTGATSWRGSSRSNNEFWGESAGVANIVGSNNTTIGANSLSSSISGSGNVALGYGAGFYETGSNKLYITNTAGTSADALIYGDFSDDALYINGKITVGTDAMDIANETSLAIKGKLQIDGVLASTSLSSSTLSMVTAVTGGQLIIHAGSADISGGFNVTYDWNSNSTSAKIDGGEVLRHMSVPATSASSGKVGYIAFDTNYLYVATGTNTWMRSPLSYF